MSDIEPENEHITHTLRFQGIVSWDHFLLLLHPTHATHSWKGWVKFHQSEVSLPAQAPMTEVQAWYFKLRKFSLALIMQI